MENWSEDIFCFTSQLAFFSCPHQMVEINLFGLSPSFAYILNITCIILVDLNAKRSKIYVLVI
jgi:hypothetical protein